MDDKEKKVLMYKQGIFFLLIACLMLTGCGHAQSNGKEENLQGYKLDYETVKADGEIRYKIDGNIYLFLKKVTGRSNNAAYDSYYIVLTNDSSITFEDIDSNFWSSDLSSIKDFVIVEYGLIES